MSSKDNLTVGKDHPDVEMAAVPAPVPTPVPEMVPVPVPAPGRWVRRARVAWRFFCLLLALITVNYLPFGSFAPSLVNQILYTIQIFGAGFTFVLIFTCGYLGGVMHMEEVVDSHPTN